jgi:hypothetical protein
LLMYEFCRLSSLISYYSNNKKLLNRPKAAQVVQAN